MEDKKNTLEILCMSKEIKCEHANTSQDGYCLDCGYLYPTGELEYIYRVYATMKNGDGLCNVIWEGDDIEDFVFYTSMFEEDLKITIHHEKK